MNRMDMENTSENGQTVQTPLKTNPDMKKPSLIQLVTTFGVITGLLGGCKPQTAQSVEAAPLNSQPNPADLSSPTTFGDFIRETEEKLVTETPKPTETLTPEPTATEWDQTQALTPSDLEKGSWGTYTFSKNVEGNYFEAHDSQGSKIESTKFYEDGVAVLSYNSTEGIKDLTVAFQAINMEEGNPRVGLWDYEEGAWSKTHSMTADEVVAGAEDTHKLVILQGHEKEQQMIDTIFLARDLAMTETEGYDPKSEFEGITVTYNFKTYENFDVRPKKWEVYNYSRARKGAYRFVPLSANNEVPYGDDGSTVNARPMQIVLGPGWFNLDVYNEDNSLQSPTVHVPLIAMNTDRSLVYLSGLLSQDRVTKITHLLNKNERGKFFFWFNKISWSDADISKLLFNDQLNHFMIKINQQYFNVVGGPKLGDGNNPDEIWHLQSLPEQLGQSFFSILVSIFDQKE